MSTGTSAQNVSRNRLGQQGRRERLLHGHAALAHLQPERREEHQAGHVLQAGRRLADHGASIGMPDKHDRAVDGLDHVADDAGVVGDPSQRVRRGEHRVPGAL